MLTATLDDSGARGAQLPTLRATGSSVTVSVTVPTASPGPFSVIDVASIEIEYGSPSASDATGAKSAAEKVTAADRFVPFQQPTRRPRFRLLARIVGALLTGQTTVGTNEYVAVTVVLDRLAPVAKPDAGSASIRT